jgi:hypothetical protein
MQETTMIKLKRNLEIGIKVSFAIGLVFFIIGNNYSDMQLWALYMGLSALAIVIGGILGFIYFLRPRTEDEQEKARNSIVVKLLRAGMVIVLIYGVISFPKELIKELISAILI